MITRPETECTRHHIPQSTPSHLEIGGLTERMRVSIVRLAYRLEKAESLEELASQAKDTRATILEFLYSIPERSDGPHG